MTKSGLANLVSIPPSLTDRRFPRLAPAHDGFCYHFLAMASPCEVHIDGVDGKEALEAGEIVRAEAARIEQKFSRYRPDSIISKINAAEGQAVEVDAETARLLDFGHQCFVISKGLFDITSGVLRRIWRFDGSGNLPSEAEIKALKPLIGWPKVYWKAPHIILPKGMEIDFGGLGKEYAVDCALLKVQAFTNKPVLVNFGGDLRVSGPRGSGERWRIAIESVDGPVGREGYLEIMTGALTTSGDARRYLLKDGIRYSHILDPRTAMPVKHAPRSVTVAAPSCIEAGFLSTLAMLQGRKASAFLKQEAVQAWVLR
jgi:thiamine biosynthesis lipoprotein